MTFPYAIDITIPAANNDPADDQPKMRDDYANIAGFLAVDHVAAGVNQTGTGGAGWHKQITYNDNNSPPGAPLQQISVAYTKLGVADITHNQNVWQNAIGTFPLSSLRAFGQFPTQIPVVANPFIITPNAPITTYNVSNITHQNGQVYIVNLTPNVVSGVQPIVLIYRSDGAAVSYTYAANTLTITTSGTSGALVNFAILQF